MVDSSLASLSQQIAQREQEIARTRAQLSQFDPKIYQSQRELFRATPKSQAVIRTQEILRGQAKEQALSELGNVEQQFKQQVAPIKSEITKQQEFELGQRYAENNLALPPNASESLRQGYKYAFALDKSAQQEKTLGQLQLKPVYDKSGNVVAFEDSLKNISYSFEQIAKFRPEAIKPLENIKYLAVDKSTQQDVNPFLIPTIKTSFENKSKTSYDIPQRVTIGGQDFTKPTYATTVGSVKDLLSAPADIAFGLSKTAGKVVTYGLEKVGVKPLLLEITPKQKIPQRVTEGGQFILPETKVYSPSPTQIGKTTEFLTGGLVLSNPYVAASAIVRPTVDLFSPGKTKLERLESGLNIALLSIPIVARGTSKKLIAEETTAKISDVEPILFASRPEIKTITTPEGKELTIATYDLIGKARQGTQLRKVDLFETSPIREVLGLEPKKLSYSDSITSLKEAGMTESQAKQFMRTSKKSPSDITLSGKAGVVFGLSDEPKISIRGEYRYEPKILQIEGFGKTRGFTPKKEVIEQGGVSLGERNSFDRYYSNPEIETRFYNKGKPSEEFMKLSQQGKYRELFEQVSASKSLGKTEGYFPIEYGVKEVRPFEIFSDVSLTKGISPKTKSSRFSRATLFVEEGEPISIIDYGQPIKISKIDTIEPKPFGKSVKLTSEQLKSLRNTLVDIYGKPSSEQLKLIGKMSLQTISKPKLTKLKTKSIDNFLIPQKYKVSTGEYAGLGIYERTEGGQVPNTKSKTGLNFLPLSESRQNIKVISRQDNALLNRSDNDERQRLRFGQISANRIKESQSNIVRQPVRSSQRFEQRFNNRLEIVPFQPVTPTYNIEPRISRPPRKPRIRIRLDDDSRRRKLSNNNQFGRDLLIAEVRRKGKFRPVSTPTSFEKAFGIGRESVRQTLGASFRLRSAKTGKLISLPSVPGFRPGKRDKFILVQQKTARLSSGGERAEIRRSRRSNFSIF